MAPRFARSRKTGNDSWADVSITDLESRGTADRSAIEALARITARPQHNSGTLQNSTSSSTEKVPILQQLLGNLPTPVRTPSTALAGFGQLGSGQKSLAPCSPPKYTPSQLASPAAPPPPSWSSLPPPPAYPALDAQWQASRSAAPPHCAAQLLLEPNFPSYREKLRAGGRGAFQRASDAGLGKNVAQEWNTPTAAAHGTLQQWPEADHQSMAMQYTSAGDADQMWSNAGQMQGNDYWGMSMDPSQMQQQQCPYGQHAHQFQQPMLPMDVAQMPSAAPLQPPDAFMPHCSTAGMMLELDVQTLQAQHQMQMVSPMNGQHLAPMPQMAPTPTSAMSSGSETPTDIDRCMAMMMPGAGQYPCDKDLVAAQLRAAADCQVYED